MIGINSFRPQRYADGSKYDGEWKFDLRSGSGTMKYANGDLYSGHFEMDKRSGAGTFTSADGLESYEGEMVRIRCISLRPKRSFHMWQ